ncbi:2-oxoglutarate dehydrogenase E1 component-like [Helianthus annuus]|uniref:2-oxoglutarate dehydrogenase E1 component-like n=1 Tax=Helianthus annuus TaxID=4232 RepID=UPI001653051F|nr:2-oxoglutarate dehydrogenase E1 component-like [Helianthus annuus]
MTNQCEEMFITIQWKPKSLVLWEAHFGDFSNGAQVIFDQLLSNGEAKWLRQAGLVVFLPPSARLECFRKMSDDSPLVIPEMEPALCNQIQTCNMQIVNVTTPANYFHVLRRQLDKEFSKPLIVMSPKNLLYVGSAPTLCHKDCKSNLSEFDDVQGHPSFVKQGTKFRRLNNNQNDNSGLEEGIRHLVLCSGKICSYLVLVLIGTNDCENQNRSSLVLGEEEEAAGPCVG